MNRVIRFGRLLWQVLNKTLDAIILGLLLALIISASMALPTMWLWNWLMPDLFGLEKINFLQAFGLNILSNLLIKGVSFPKS